MVSKERKAVYDNCMGDGTCSNCHTNQGVTFRVSSSMHGSVGMEHADSYRVIDSAFATH